MKTKEINAKYDVWLNAENMHRDSRNWLSELRFAQDEELFLDDLVKSYTLQLIDTKHFAESKKVIEKLSKIQKETDTLIEIVKNHEKGLSIMVDGINEFDKEKAFKNKHVKLIINVKNFLEKYRTLKTELFAVVKSVLKEGKQKRLLE
ncbi:hypothetical protein V8G61_03085 [Gaetbulibacter sp. M240]|uniref:hypothetical protein n=1 Tax=Gaetbulibacter sp. M240 TaxID=3126511 RepID=UPI00374F01C2